MVEFLIYCVLKSNFCQIVYSHLSNSRAGWNKRAGGTKVAKSINVEAGINEEVGRTLRNQ